MYLRPLASYSRALPQSFMSVISLRISPLLPTTYQRLLCHVASRNVHHELEN